MHVHTRSANVAVNVSAIWEHIADVDAKAKQDGKYKGRKPTARAKTAEVIKLDDEGLQRTEIARRTGIGVASVYRVLADAKKPSACRTVER